jgi:hypothetical protein
MKRILIGLAVLALVAGTAFAGNSRILVTLPAGALSATTTVTTAQLGANVQVAEVIGVSYVFSAASLTNVVLASTCLTAAGASLPVAATVGTGTAALSSSSASSYPVCIVPGDKLVVTTTATNDVATKVIYSVRTSLPQGI